LVGSVMVMQTLPLEFELSGINVMVICDLVLARALPGEVTRHRNGKRPN